WRPFAPRERWIWRGCAPRAGGKPVAAEGHSGIDALSQFKLAPVFGSLGESLHFSNANVMMLAALALSLFVFCLVTFVALKEHGLHFFSYFVPKGIPVVLTPLMVLIEVISYL